MLTGHRAKVPGVGTRRRIITEQKHGAIGVDRVDPFDDLESGAVGTARDDDVANVELRPPVDWAGDYARAGR